MADVVNFPGAQQLESDATLPDPVLIGTLEAALEQAHAGVLNAFIMVFERPDGTTDSLYDTAGSKNLKLLLAELHLEAGEVARYISDATRAVNSEGA